MTEEFTFLFVNIYTAGFRILQYEEKHISLIIFFSIYKFLSYFIMLKHTFVSNVKRKYNNETVYV